MTPETFCIYLVFACFLAAIFRARWVALALLPAITGIIASNFVDISSASHPLRVAAPVAGLLLAVGAAYKYAQWVMVDRMAMKDMDLRLVDRWRVKETLLANTRALIASILLIASTGPDLLALFMWRIPGEWVLVPFQIAICSTILVVLLAPERWVRRWL